MIEEIRNWRNKYPGAYDDLDDFTLAKMIANKWPGEYDDLPDRVQAEGKVEPITGTEETVLRKEHPRLLEGPFEAAEMAGMTGGAIVGASVGGPFAPATAAIGGGLGYAAAR